MQKYFPKTAPSYIKLMKEFPNSGSGEIHNPLGEWLDKLKGLKNKINTISVLNKKGMPKIDLILHICQNFQKIMKALLHS